MRRATIGGTLGRCGWRSSPNTDSGGDTDPDAVAAALRAAGAEVTLLDIADAARAADSAPSAWWSPAATARSPRWPGVAARRGLAARRDAHGHGQRLRPRAGPPARPRRRRRAGRRPARPRSAPIELACADERAFVNAACTGLPVDAARPSRTLKPRLGRWPTRSARCGPGYRAAGDPVVVRVDGEEVFDGRAWQAIVAGTGAFGGGGGVDEADPADGRLDPWSCPAGSRASLVRRAWGMRTGRVARQRGVTHRRGRLLEIETPAGTALNVDGELCRLHPTSFSARRDAVAIVVP